MTDKGKLFVVSAPSGAGKTTLVREVLARFPSVAYSVSHTTRSPREGEVHGQDYFFTDTVKFEAMIEKGHWLEWAKVHGNFYGTSRLFVDEKLARGVNLLLDIDVQGARQIMESGLSPVLIFIMPPSLDVLCQRLEIRGTDAREVIDQRMKNAKKEMAQASLYKHLVVNDELDQAVGQLSEIFDRELGRG